MAKFEKEIKVLDIDVENIKEKLELSNNEIVSLNTEQLYKRTGIDVHSMSELKF